MSFPTTGILDNFTRANSLTLGTNWNACTNVNWYGTDPLGITSDSAYDTTGAAGGASTWINSFSGTLEVYVTISTFNSSNIGTVLFFSPNSSLTATVASSYALSIDNISGSIKLFKVTGTGSGSGTTLTTISQATFNNGDSIGMSCSVGGSFIIYYQPVSSVWGQIGTASDTTFVRSYMGISFSDTTTRLSNFGGGTQVSTIKMRKELTPNGTRTGSRQVQWGHAN